MPVSLDIVLPCYNPNDTWHKELLEFYGSTRHLYQLQFIVVNDGSVTGNVAEQIASIQKTAPVSFISYTQNKGKGYALRQGVAASKSEALLYTDIDFPFTSASMIAVANAVISGECDIAAGYRSRNYYGEKMSFYRKILSKAFRFFTKRLLGMPVSDTQCGLKGFNKKGKKKFLSTRINRYLFDFEFIFKSGKDKTVSVRAVEVQLKDNVVFSRMKPKILIQETVNLLYILLFSRR